MKELLIEKENNKIKLLLLDNDILIEKYEEDLEDPMLEDNIYIGKVQNVFNGMQSAFVNIGSKKNVFIHLEDVLPKEDVAKGKKNADTNISDLIKPGKPIIVQVMKDASHKKGARVTTHIALKGRFVIYMPNVAFVTVSQKIKDENKRETLKGIVKKYLPDGDGAVIRTCATSSNKENIKKEIDFLVNKWNEIKNTEIDEYPKLISDAGGILGKYIIDIVDKGLDKIIVNCDEIEEKVKLHLKDLNINIKVYKDSNLLERIGLKAQLQKAENRKIWLDCGGFITIDKTEALTAIDVNSGKYTGKKDFEETIFEINKEASIEIAKQLRLRDIGGIIIIDYIDMKKEDDKEKIIKILKEETDKDISKVQIEGMSKLNLLELTRKHVYSK